jgi:hypothetical protein
MTPQSNLEVVDRQGGDCGRTRDHVLTSCFDRTKGGFDSEGCSMAWQVSSLVVLRSTPEQDLGEMSC